MSRLQEWDPGSSYYGTEWPGWLVAPIKLVDHSTTPLDYANWQAQDKRLSPFGSRVMVPDPDGREDSEPIESVMEFRIKYNCGPCYLHLLLIHPANAEAVAEAERIADEIEAYPCLDEDLWGEKQVEAEYKAWTDYAAYDFKQYLLKYCAEVFEEAVYNADDDTLWRIARDLGIYWEYDSGGQYWQLDRDADVNAALRDAFPAAEGGLL